MDSTDRAALALCLAGTARGERAAFADLYRRTSGKLFAVIRRILGRADVAEEALQEAYLKIWSQAARYDDKVASPMTWMIAIARNQAIDVRRRGAERVSDAASALEDVTLVSASGAAAIEQSADLRHLSRCLDGLEEQPRAMVLLAYHQGWSREELARRFERPVATVKTLLRRGLLALKDCLDAPH